MAHLKIANPHETLLHLEHWVEDLLTQGEELRNSALIFESDKGPTEHSVLLLETSIEYRQRAALLSSLISALREDT